MRYDLYYVVRRQRINDLPSVEDNNKVDVALCAGYECQCSVRQPKE